MPGSTLLITLLLRVFISAYGLHVIQDVITERPEGTTVLYNGPPNSAFDRPPPHTIDPSVLLDFEEHFNRTQAFSAQGNNTFLPDGQQFVIRIADGYVNGITGAIFDGRGQIYSQFIQATSSLPHDMAQIQGLSCRRFKKLATTIQKYGHMYFHFMQEVLPRVLLLKPFLLADPEVKLLMFGSSYEADWLQAVGIDPSRAVMYDPTATYCADELLVPTPSTVITPAKETYELVRSYFAPAQPAPPVEGRDLIIYCSRAGASDRQVSNEEELLAAMRAALPAFHIITYTGVETVAETLNLFRRARAVVGMHGAGLSHIIFSPSGTAVVEITFMHDPPLMFWHASAAMGLEYWMVPQPQAYWLSPKVAVSVQDVIDATTAALHVTENGAALEPCTAGLVFDATTKSCTRCPAGTYRPATAAQCIECESGRFSSSGAAACRVCPYDTYEQSLTMCQACPEGTRTVLPGSHSIADCRTDGAMGSTLDWMFNRDQLANKLAHIPALMERLHAAQGTGRRGLLSHVEQEVHDLQLSFLDDLFGDHADEHVLSDEAGELEGEKKKELHEGEDGEAGRQLSYVGRRLTASGAGRRLLAYGGQNLMAYGGSRRRLAGYGSERRLSSSGGVRQLAGYGGGRRLLGYGNERRLAGYGGGRRMLGYGSVRRLAGYASGRH